MQLLLLLVAGASFALGTDDPGETDGEQSRKILGSSVVTSVSVIMDTGNGSKTVYTDAAGKPVPKPSSASDLGSPIDLLNPDRYEFYTFDDNGDLIKRLMSLEEIQGIIATGDSDGYDLDSFTSLGYLPEKRVNDVVNTVQNVLKEEMETHKAPTIPKPMFDTPDVSDSWSMILPAVFGNSGEDIKPERPIAHVTPDTIMIEPNMQDMYTSSITQKITSAVTASPDFVTSASTPRSTSLSQAPTKSPTVFSTSAQMSTTDKLLTLGQTATTNRIPALTPTANSKPKPVINVEIYSNSKSTTEKPLDQLSVETAPVVEIKPNASDASKPSSEPVLTTKKPPVTMSIELSTEYATQTKIKSTTNLVEHVTNQPSAPVTFIPTLGSTLPTTKAPLKQTSEQLKTTSALDSEYNATTPSIPTLTKHTTEGHISTWRPELFNSVSTEPETITEELPLSTWIPNLTTTEKIETIPDDLPTLAQLLNLNRQSETKTPELTTTSYTTDTPEQQTTSVSDENKNKEEITTTDIIQETTDSKLTETKQSTERYVPEDLSTLGSEVFTTKLNIPSTTEPDNRVGTTTQLPLEQSMTNDQKISATELLDQLLFTTNIYEINTELAEKTTEQQTLSNEDERFETNTQEESKLSEVKTEPPTTTEQFLIKVVDQNEEPATDKNLIDSIEQLISQAVGNTEDVLNTINNTQSIEQVLSNSGTKNMTDVRIESATVASNLISLNNAQEENEKTTTEISILDSITSGQVNILSDSVGALLSQVYESNQAIITTNAEVTTEKEFVPTTVSDEKGDNIELGASSSDTSEAISHTDNNSVTFPVTETTTSTSTDEIGETTTIAYVPINTIDKNSTNNDNFVPHLINITIISPDNAIPNIRNSSYKPAKLDVSLEQMLDEEYKKNTTLAESTESYSELTTVSTDNTNDTIPNELLKAEETMAALYNKSEVTTELPTTTTEFSDLQETTELSTEESTITTEYILPIKQVPALSRKPTTVVIIKKTEKPLIDSYTTLSSINSNLNEDLTTISIESTTFDIQQTAATQPITEESIQTTTDYIQEDSKTESMTDKIINLEPVVDIIINENKTLDKNLQNINSNQQLNSVSANLRKEGTNSAESAIERQTQPPINKVSTTPPLNAEIKEFNKPAQKPGVTLSEDKPGGTWTLVPTIAPHGEHYDIHKEPAPVEQYPEIIDPPTPVDLEAKPLQGFGLEDSTSRLDTDIYQFAQLCNELAFGFWKTVTNGLSSARSVFVSPFGATSLLAMVFLGARGATSGEMNEILRLDDMVTFNPHLIFKNVTESIKTDELDSGVASSAIIRELFSDRSKGKLLPFYKERAKAFYDGYVEEASFREIGDVIRRRTNLQVKKYTNGKIGEYLKDSSINARSPLAGVSANIFQTDCSQASTEGRDGELHFVVLPSIRQRRLIPVPAVVYRSGFLAGYETSLDATAVALGTKEQTVSTILVIPGQQGISAPGDGLSRLEKRLVESSFKKGAWSRLLRSLIPRPGLEVQIPRFAHRSVINATVALKKMGLHDLFDVEKADLRGLNGVANELFLSDMLQINSFATCGEKRIGETHHSEIYPATTMRARNSRYLDHFESEESFWRSDLLEEPRDYQRAFLDPLHDPSFLSLPLSLRPRQARIPETPRLRFDRPFIYFVRHNPTGLILHMGRFNPRLLP